MLFISRRVADTVCHDSGAPKEYYGVVDTDDDVETVISFSDLFEIVNAGIQIEGVKTERMIGPKRGWNLRITGVFPYQLSSSKQSAKALLVGGVTVSSYKSTVTGITWNPVSLGVNVKLRLSNFGDSCADYIIDCLVVGEHKHLVVLVFDDNLKSVTEHSFQLGVQEWKFATLGLESQDSTGVALDLRDLKTDDLARVIYKQIFEYGGHPERWVKDNVERKARFQLLYS